MIEQGTTINGRYRVDRLIGEGGMATVFVGHDLLLGRDVAIKALRPQYAADPQFRARFRREAQAAAGFSHPNIVDIYDVGEVGGTPYFVMEHVRGQTLKQIIEEEGPFHPDDVAGLMQQLCAALDYAHERGYVHRDVKPQNVLVSEDGHAIVVDFGIAKSLADADLTEVGAGLGTVQYLSPEQASGLVATPASDIYSAGVIAFEMLTRALPFEADTPVGIAMKHVREAPPAPSDILPSIPPAVDDIVLRALDKDPTRRFPSAGAFARALTYWRQYRPPAVASPRPGPAPATADTARVAPVASQPTRVLPAAEAPPPVRPVEAIPPREAATSRAGGGCLTWAIGAAILAGLVALIVFGSRFAGIGGNGGTGGGGVATTVAVAPTAVETDQPAIVPVASEPPLVPVETPTPLPAPPTEAPAAATAPDLVGRTLDEATALAASQGLGVEVGPEVASEDFAAGQVVFQDPPPGGQVPAGAPVLVQLSSGPDMVDTAAMNLLGLPYADVERLLADAGVLAQREDVGSRSVPEGAVVAIQPPGPVFPGDTVTVQVSVGDKVQIPVDIQGRPLDRAVQRLEERGLTVANEIPVDRRTVETFGIDLDAAGIEDRDVVGVQGGGAEFGGWVPRGTTVDVVYYDRRGGRE